MLHHIYSIASSILWLTLVCPAYSAKGFVGYGISMYKPPCAHACRASITNPLNCSTSSDNDMVITWKIERSPGPECYATNDAFLQTLAYCIYSHCEMVPNSTLQRYWEMNVAGSEKDQPLPKEAYQQALQSIGFKPTITPNVSTVLGSASLVSEELYNLNWRTLAVFEKVEATHERYGLVLLLTGAIIPIGLSFARFIPVPTKLKTTLDAYVVAPPLIGYRHKVPLFNTFNMPTRGQALFIAYLIIINVVLCAVGINSADPSAWYTSNRVEILTYVGNRAGILSFANIPLLVLYSSRNNILLWLTNWSHSTFLLLHRWIALICVIEACLHSAIYLQIYSAQGEHSSESKLAYWYWGIIATLAMVIIVPGSMLQVRQRFYEFFLAWHVIFFLLAMVGCCLHIYYRYNFQWGYENWIYVALAVWGFERGMRILRFARHGICTAHVAIVDDEYIKLEIPGVAAKGDVYLYFPTLTWRVWENHPFSVLTDICCASLGADRFDRLNAAIFQNSRMDISRILREEVSRCAGTEVAVIVSGPSKMADEKFMFDCTDLMLVLDI
ncbi:ferric reductase like transmembrane component-domain-containing protein [Aspergillus pseudotamarii]|uniref:Ferric reductase like transmembrane component-domain-containing protein n=1 Tax=Aspergillus pseudotamarii TaxID=132259 RepID=A0A5N6SRS3_ASPPS|nr:ferric reductase like transmembrane component-domain-containing protein [Aspergillus pseudotamarii]KAE8136481.1 ferric reductase like transmembrane component-domain-containing protein [Aspergillus pseudotamarii]